jgi:hypothetical protein
MPLVAKSGVTHLVSLDVECWMLDVQGAKENTATATVNGTIASVKLSLSVSQAVSEYLYTTMKRSSLKKKE